MSQLILHKDGAYQIYSTISDGPYYVTALTLKQLRTHIRKTYGESGIRDLPQRLERAHRTGCSSVENMSLSDVIACNRAGPEESELSLDEFVAQHMTLPEDASANE